jgi:ABC-2 type transport system permease protein
MRAAILVALKDLRLLVRDRVALFWVFAFPLLFALLLGSVLQAASEGSRAPLALVAVDEAGTARSHALVEALESSGTLAVARSDLTAARDAVRRAEAVAYVRIGPEFDASPRDPARGLELGIDPSRRAEAAALQILTSNVVRRLAAAPEGIDDPSIAVSSVSPEGSSARGFSLAFPAAVLWGLMGCAASFAIATVTERSAGTLLRLRAAPISPFAILGGKALACFFACLLDSALIVGVALVGFGVSIEDAWGLLLAIVCASACFAGITLAMGAMGKSEQSVAGAGWAALIVMAMLGGAMVPLAFMPEWLVRLSVLSPVKWGITALEGAVWRAFHPAELAVPCAVLLAVGTAAFFAAAALMRREEA